MAWLGELKMSNHRLEKRVTKRNKRDEYGPLMEIRSITEDGVFDGYIVVWDSVDDYNSKFQRGCFTKTIKERGKRIKVFYDHEHLVGSAIEVREDDYGVYAKGKLNLAVEKAREAYEFMKDETIEGLSFGFRTIKDTYDNGIRVIKELALYEFGPVAFPANEKTLILSVRSKNYNESLSDVQLQQKMYGLREALWLTLEDIWYSSDVTFDNIIGMMDDALSEFHSAYLTFVGEWINRYWKDSDGNQIRKSPFANELADAFRSLGKTPEEISSETSLTLYEARNLKYGRIIEARNKLDELPDLKPFHQTLRSGMVEKLCTELRSNLTAAEIDRIEALLSFRKIEPAEPDEDEKLFSDLQVFLSEFRNNLTK